ncbi:hypothetical protein J4050_11370 [Winogradskyella sp. DF17]|uniref:Uncharacterized protein n=1 Tax=Winogradskyella pelagia TaxID=2819984 RepID=A0ABS3T3M2_9FLAO|nr:hypothetical protein [Winogradskyella sp. DF17]MBO3117351.1 hypothetical protein [Winogradskyella sp. DF17]
MFLKAFKKKSNQKYVNNLLANRRASVNSKKVVKVGVLLHIDEYDNFESFRTFFKALGLNAPTHKVVGFVTDDNYEDSQWETFFSPKDFGWKGRIKNTELQAFIDQDFDVLVSYYNQKDLYLDWITAASQANLKVGLTREDERLFDLFLDVDAKAFETFKTEFEKYLHILNKL